MANMFGNFCGLEVLILSVFKHDYEVVFSLDPSQLQNDLI